MLLGVPTCSDKRLLRKIPIFSSCCCKVVLGINDWEVCVSPFDR